MSSEITDPEVLAFIERTEAAYPPNAVELSIAGQRKVYDQMTELFRQPRPAEIAVEGGGIPRPDGGLIPVRRYWPRGPEARRSGRGARDRQSRGVYRLGAPRSPSHRTPRAPAKTKRRSRR